MTSKMCLIKNLVGKARVAKTLSNTLNIPMDTIYYDKEKPYNKHLFNKDNDVVNEFYRHPFIKTIVKRGHPDIND